MEIVVDCLCRVCVQYDWLVQCRLWTNRWTVWV